MFLSLIEVCFMADDPIQRLATAELPLHVRAELLTELGTLRLQTGQAHAAQAALAAAHQLQPSQSRAHTLGLAALAAGDTAAAVDALEDAAARSDSPEARTQALANAGAAAVERGDLHTAKLRFEEARDERASAGLPESALLLVNLARVLQRLEQPHAAQALLVEATEAASTPAERSLVALRLAELAEDPLPWLDRALSGSLGDAEARTTWLQRAQLLGERGDHQGAIHSLQMAGNSSARDVFEECSRLSALGGYRYQVGDIAGARSALDRAAVLLPEDAAASSLATRLRINRGLTRLAQGELDPARSDLEQATEDLRARGDLKQLAPQLAALVDLHRYAGDLSAAIDLQTELLELERHLDGPLPEGAMLYGSVEDRSLSVSLSDARRAGPGPGDGPVLFVVPPAWGASGPLFPRGAVSVASFLQEHGVPAQVLPLAHVVEPKDSATIRSERIARALEDAVSALRPRAIGLSVTFSYLMPQAREHARMLRALVGPAIPIVIGGPHVTYVDRDTLAECPELDIVVRGEGEWTALELFETLRARGDLAQVKGITWRASDGQIHRNGGRKLGDVRALPPVDFSLVPAAFAHRMDASVLTSRGCAFRCKFCHEFRYWGGIVREFTVDRIIGEMERLARYGNHLQGIDDSMLDMSTPFFMELVEALGESDHVHPDFGLLTRLDTVTQAGCEAMAKAGLRWVSMGAESGSQTVLDAMNKGLAVGRTRESLQLVRDAGLSSAAFFIVGHPGDSEAESQVTLDFLDGLFQDDLVDWIDVSTFSPYPGTAFYRSPERHGIEILTRDWSRWRRSNRPVSQLRDYPAAAIYRTYLRMLATQVRHRGAAGPPAPALQSTGA